MFVVYVVFYMGPTLFVTVASCKKQVGPHPRLERRLNLPKLNRLVRKFRRALLPASSLCNLLSFSEYKLQFTAVSPFPFPFLFLVPLICLVPAFIRTIVLRLFEVPNFFRGLATRLKLLPVAALEEARPRTAVLEDYAHNNLAFVHRGFLSPSGRRALDSA